MNILDLVKQIHKWRNDPFHYNFHEALDLLVDTLEKKKFIYAANLAKYVQKKFKEDLQIPIDTSKKLKQLYEHLKRKLKPCYHKWDFFGQFCNACGEFTNHGEVISKCLKCGVYWGNEFKTFLNEDEIENLKAESNWDKQEIIYSNRMSNR